MKNYQIYIVYVQAVESYARVFTTKKAAEIYCLYIAKKYPEYEVKVCPDWLYTTNEAKTWYGNEERKVE